MEEITWTAAVAVTARAFNVRLPQVLDCRGRQTRAAGAVLAARRGAIYLANVAGSMPVRALCRATGMDHTTIRHHLHAVEDDRELRAGLDALVDQLTKRLQLGIAELAATVPPSMAQTFSGPLDDDTLRWLFVDEHMEAGRIAQYARTPRVLIERRLAGLGLGVAA
jgi:DNA-binding transcriptional ArsR family regulator